MPTSSTASRQRYIEYQKRLRRGELASRDGVRKKTQRRRTFRHLFRLFWDLLRGQRVTFFVALTTLTMATMVSLTLPVSTKIALDYVLADNPGPTALPEWLPRESRIQLLWMLAGAMIVVTVVTISLGMWGRWQTTRLTKRLQVKLKRTVLLAPESP